ncbi:hypothetical protein F5I97DRAFT_1976872 [Phlebopus sp. FC_14]|nr:hypothetical protein F5I97DRAFT_1976872 [Phlebopus sp. FC_14]
MGALGRGNALQFSNSTPMTTKGNSDSHQQAVEWSHSRAPISHSAARASTSAQTEVLLQPSLLTGPLLDLLLDIFSPSSPSDLPHIDSKAVVLDIQINWDALDPDSLEGPSDIITSTAQHVMAGLATGLAEWMAQGSNDGSSDEEPPEVNILSLSSSESGQ